MGPTAFIIGAAIGSGLVALVLLPRTRLLARQLRDKQAEQEEQRGRSDELHETVTDLTAQVSRLQEQLAHEKTLSGERLKAFEEASGQMRTQFESISGKVLTQSTTHITQIVKGELTKERTAATNELEIKQRELRDLVNPISQLLGKVENRIEQSEKERHSTAAKVATQLQAVAQAQGDLRKETGALVTSLRRPHVRGRWGEMQLRNVVATAGMESFCDFSTQASVNTDDGLLRPDMTVNLPAGKVVVVDAKAPLDAYIDANEAPDQQAADGHLKRHATQMKSHIDKLSTKEFWAQFPNSPDLVIMFVPGEQFLSAALEQDPQLLQHAAQAKVMIATPATLLTMLSSVHYGWQQEQLAEGAQEIAELGRKVYGHLCNYLVHVKKVGKQLNSTVEAYNKSIGTLDGRLLGAARKLDEHGVVAAGKELADVTPIDVRPRELQSAESKTDQVDGEVVDLPTAEPITHDGDDEQVA